MKLTEGELEFDFEDLAWSKVMKFDEHTDYKKIKDLVPETRGVDFTGILNSEIFVAIEVKDFRGWRIAEKNRDEPLPIEVAKKIVGTLATVFAGCRTSTHDIDDWIQYAELIRKQAKQVYIVLWIENDPLPSGQKRELARRSNLRQDLKKRLSWLGCKSFIANLDDYNAKLFQLKVKNIPSSSV